MRNIFPGFANFTLQDHRRIWHIAGPMILSGLTTPLLGMVDTAMMGHLAVPQYLGAVAVGAMILQLIFWGFGFLRMSTTAFAAQALGMQDGDAIRTVLARAILLAIVFAVSLLLLKTPIKIVAFDLVNASSAVEENAQLYFDIRVWSAPATLLNYALLGWFLGNHNARFPLYMMLLINGANIVFDLVFVVLFSMRADGVAYASVLAEYIGLVFGVYLVYRQLHKYPGRWQIRAWFERASFIAMMHVNKDIFLRTLGLLFAFSFFTAQSAKFGDTLLAVNSVLLNFQYAMAYGLDGYAHAAEALVGKSVGSKNHAALRRDVQLTGFWSFVTAMIFAIVYCVFGTNIIALLTDLNNVRSQAEHYLFWLWLTPLVSVWAFWLDGVFIGLGASVALRNSMLGSLVVFLIAWYVLQFWQNHGLWAAFLVFMAARGATLGYVYLFKYRSIVH